MTTLFRIATTGFVITFGIVTLLIHFGSQVAIAQELTQYDLDQVKSVFRQWNKAISNIAQVNTIMKSCESKLASGDVSSARECVTFLEEIGFNLQIFNAGIDTSITNHGDLLPSLNYTNSTS